MGTHKQVNSAKSVLPVVTQLFDIYPDLAVDAQPQWLGILEKARKIEMPAGTILLTASEKCTDLMLLLEGSLRIYQLSEDGREMTLYRINPGDICMMSLSSLIHDRPFKANAESETASVLWPSALPVFSTPWMCRRHFGNAFFPAWSTLSVR